MHAQTRPKYEPEGGVVLPGTLVLLLLIMLAGAALFCGWVFLQRVDRLYQGVIYPNVYALGVDLSGKPPAQAASALEAAAGQVDTGLLILTDGEQRWSYAWSQAGLHVDTLATAQAAYTVGRYGGWRAQLEIWMRYHEVAPRFAFDPEAARGLLEALATEVSVPPVEPTIALENGQVVVLPGQAGRVLDVSSTLAKLTAARGTLYRVEIPLDFQTVVPAVPNVEDVKAQAEVLLTRVVNLSAYDVLTDETLAWTLDRDEIAPWLILTRREDQNLKVDVNLYAIQTTLRDLAAALDGGRGFRFEEAAQQILETFDAGGGNVVVYLTHPARSYVVQAGDTLTSLSAKFGMPPGLVAEANREIDIDRLQVGQEITIPSPDVLVPYIPVPGKRIVINLDAQRMRVYEQDALLWDWLVSTGKKDSPTHRGIFQILNKELEAYASQWDLWMPYFMAIYPAGGTVYNGIHELPILASGQRLWAGNLGHPASFGCIILGIPDAEMLYNWAEVGVLVVIE